MSKFRKDMDPKYTKISAYVIVSVVTIFIICSLLSFSGGFFKKVAETIGLVLKPIVIGGIIAYLFAPLIRWEEKKLNRKGSRPIAVFGTLILIILILFAFGYMLILFINQSFENVELNSLVDLNKIYASQITDVWNSISAWLENNNVDVGQVSESFSGMINSVTSAVTDLTFASMFAIYFLLDWDDISAYWNRVLNVFFKSFFFSYFKN